MRPSRARTARCRDALIRSGGAREPGCILWRASPPTRSGSPVTDTRILLLGTAASESLSKVLGRPGRALTRIENADDLAAKVADRDIVVIDVVPPPRTLAEMCREVRAIPDARRRARPRDQLDGRRRGADPAPRGRRRRRHDPPGRRARAGRPRGSPRPAPPAGQGAPAEHPRRGHQAARSPPDRRLLAQGRRRHDDASRSTLPSRSPHAIPTASPSST